MPYAVWQGGGFISFSLLHLELSAGIINMHKLNQGSWNYVFVMEESSNFPKKKNVVSLFVFID